MGLGSCCSSGHTDRRLMPQADVGVQQMVGKERKKGVGNNRGKG